MIPNIIIFGASRGLGRALLLEHLQRGWTATATVRNSNALDDLRQSYGDRLTVEVMDTTDWASVDALHFRLEGQIFDTLFVNAGISAPQVGIGTVDPDIFDEVMRVNALAPLRIVDRYSDLVMIDGTIAVMSSALGSVTNNSSGDFETYRISKAALNMGLRSISARTLNNRRTYIAVAPGWVQTDMSDSAAPLKIEDSIPRVADMLTIRRGSGGVAYVSYENVELPW